MIYPKICTQSMTILSKYTLFITAGIVLFTACKSSEFSGYSYDPEGVTDTETRVITPQHKRTIGFMEDGVWFSNEFKGARISDAYRVGKLHYKLIIDPEIAPINISSWYGFKEPKTSKHNRRNGVSGRSSALHSQIEQRQG